MEEHRLTLKEKIEKEHGSINKFVDANYTKLGISRTYFYSLLNGTAFNPTIDVLNRLSILTKIPMEELFDEYSMRYRNGKPSDQYGN